jgi:hypothetical protein
MQYYLLPILKNKSSQPRKDDMSRIRTSAESADTLIENLKSKQQSCTQILLDCLATREKFPHMAPRIDKIIGTIEAVMSENADLLSRLETNLGVDSARQLTVPQPRAAVLR